MDLDDIALTTLDGRSASFGDWAGQVRLVVNVASRCGFASQYARLEELHQRYGDRGLAVLGFPSNQFLQELGSTEAIQEYCSMTYGVTFPMFEKVKLNGRSAHPLFQALTSTPAVDGTTGKVRWNFEKFLLTPAGDLHRYRSTTEPDAPQVVDVIEAALPER